MQKSTIRTCFVVYYLTNTLKQMVKFENASFGYSKRHPIYEKLNLELRPGRIYGLFGKNGEGKSTLLRNICGLLFPTSGSITVNGHEPKLRKPDFLSDIFLIPEDVQLPNLSVRQYVKTYGVFYPNFSENDFYENLSELEVSENQQIKSMSYGQQKKVLIAFALATNVSTLIMDEPTNGLDIPSKSQFRKLIASNLTEDRTFVISTHQVRDLDNLIDHVLVMNQGKFVLNAGLDEITEKFSSKLLPKSQLNDDVIYAEETLGGYAALTKNTTGEYSKINLEHLFTAAVLKPEIMREIFSEPKTTLQP